MVTNNNQCFQEAQKLVRSILSFYRQRPGEVGCGLQLTQKWERKITSDRGNILQRSSKAGKSLMYLKT